MAYKYELGIIGCGKMGQGILSGVIKAKKYPLSKIAVTSGTKEEVKEFKEAFPGIPAFTDNKKVAKDSRILLIAVKPFIFPIVSKELKDVVKKDQVIISIVAGLSISNIENMITSVDIAGRQKVVRVMPNMNAIVLESMSAICDNGRLTEPELKEAVDIFSRVGKTKRVKESDLDIVTGVSGSSPAFVFMMIEAMADAAVAEGFPRASAYEFAAQAVMGSAKLVLESGRHPGALKDDICSPKGTTIEGVNVLEDCAFRSAVMNAVRATIEKSRNLNEQ